jgi:cysteine desulfurase/selenocysteine lyase
MNRAETIPPLVSREQFPLLARMGAIAYLDSAASAQKPLYVLDAWRDFYESRYANIHRGVYALSEAATEAYEAARTRVARYLGSPDANSIVFVRNATEAINLVAKSWGRHCLRQGDAIVLTLLEHHSNIVPWQMLAQEKGVEIRFAKLDAAGDLDFDHLASLVDRRTRLVSVTAAANTLGTKVPIKRVVEIAKQAGARVLVDAAQAAPHFPIDVRDWDCDFLALTGHKLYGPDGIGALYARPELLREMPAFMGGGGMITTVTTTGTVYADPPQRFEAGTPAIGEAVGLAAALDFIDARGWPSIEDHERRLTSYALEQLRSIPGVRIVGEPQERVGIVSLVVDGSHPHDVGTLLGDLGVCVRAGHHCAQPLMAALGLPGTVRASFGLYNGSSDIDRLAEGLARARQALSR